MPKYRVNVSKEAGIYTQDFIIETDGRYEAEIMAVDKAKNTEDGWEYVDLCYEALYQAEEVLKID